MHIPITVAETSTFSRKAEKLWNEDEQEEFVDFIAFNPDAGVIIPHTAGLRKIRWQRQGMGKRGGVRIIYYYYTDDIPLYLITAYAKAQRENLLPAEKQAFVALIDKIKQTHRSRSKA